MKKSLTLALAFSALLLARAGHAQSVGIGTPNPNAKAALEIAATDRGLLIPRLTAAQRTGIVGPPQGLMVYQTDGTASGGTQTGFWYYAGSPAAWVYLSPTAAGDNLGNHTATQNLNLTDKLLVGGTAGLPSLDGLKIASNSRVGVGLGAAAPAYPLEVGGSIGGHYFYSDQQIGLAFGAGAANTSAFLGTGATPGLNTTGTNNTAVGSAAAGNLTSGAFNTLVGAGAGYQMYQGTHNTAVGYYAGYSLNQGNAASTASNDNTYLGYQAARDANQAAGNTALGTNAALNLRAGDNNTFVGSEADLSSAATQHTNATAIGYQAKVNQDNSLVLGGTGASAVSVGIGTVAPTERLQVVGGDVKIGTAAWATAADDRLLKFGDGNLVTLGETDGSDLLQLRAKDFRFNRSSTTSGYTGNVGIGLGATVAPTATLDVARGTGSNGTAIFRGTDRTSHFSYSTAEDTYIRGGKATANVLLNDDSGRVGVGTSAPFSQLANTTANVVGADGYGVGEKSLTWSSNLAGYAGAIFNANAGAGQNGLAVKVAGANAAATALDVSQGTAGTAGASLLTVRANGYVGIGSANPNATLEVRRGTAPDGTAAFYGTTRTSHFNYNTAEDTYLRGGKSASNVYINDTGGNVGVGTSTVSHRLEVAGTAYASNNDGSVPAVVGANANTGGFATGVQGSTAGNGYGVRGLAGTNGYGVSGSADGSGGRGVDGFALNGTGVYAETESGYAMQAIVSNTGANNGYALKAQATDGVGVQAIATTGKALSASAAGTGPAATITQSGTGLALDVTGGAVRTPAVRTPGTGTANMLPLAYGNVNSSGTLQTSSGNVTTGHPSTGIYYIGIVGQTLTNSNCVVLVQLTGPSNGDPLYFQATSGNYLVQVNGGSGGALSDASFNFIIFKP